MHNDKSSCQIKICNKCLVLTNCSKDYVFFPHFLQHTCIWQLYSHTHTHTQYSFMLQAYQFLDNIFSKSQDLGVEGIPIKLN